VAHGIYSYRAPRSVVPALEPSVTSLIGEESTAALHRAFKMYMGVTQEGLGVKDALKKYLNSWDQRGAVAENQRLFLDDVDFMRNVGAQFNMPGPRGTEAKTKNIVAALLSEIDFSAALLDARDDGVTYNGYTFRGLGQRPLVEAKQLAERFITAKLKDYLGVGENDVARLGQLILSSMAPEFSLIDADGLSLRGIHYGDRKWGKIRAGIAIAHSLHNQLKDYTLSELRELGHAFLMESATATDDALAAQESDDLSLNEMVLMLMADVSGAIDLSKMNEQSQENDAGQFERFITNEFKGEIAINEARLILLQTMPTRANIAERLLREAGEDPQRMVTCDLYDIEGKPAGSYQQILINLYMDQGFFQFVARSIPSLEERRMLSRLPDLSATFNAEFERYTNNFKQALSDFLKNQLELRGEDIEDKTFHILKSGIKYITSEEKTVLWDSTTSYMDVQYEVMGENIFFIENQHSSGKKVFYVSEGEILKGLQEIPNSQTMESWIKGHLSCVVGEDDLKTMRNTGTTLFGQTLGPHTITGIVEKIASGDVGSIANRIAERFVRERVASKKEQAYAASLHEQVEDKFLDFMIPGRSGVKNLIKGEYFDAAIDFGLDIIIFIPFGKLFRLGKLVSHVGNAASTIMHFSRLNINKLTRLVNREAIRFDMVSNQAIVRQAQKNLIALANEIARDADGVKALSLVRGGAVCWDAVAKLEYKANFISKSRLDDIWKVRAGSYDQYIDAQRSVTIRTAEDFEGLPAGTRIGFFDAENHLKHAMLKLEQGNAIGINNGYLDPAWSGGWKKIDLSKKLTWRDNAVFSADGIRLEIRVEG